MADTYANDPNLMRRPGSISVTTPTSVSRWTSGTYTYDGAGNVKAIGTHTFTYDKVSRLTAANLYLEPTASTTLRTQTFGYDAFGNLLSFGGSSARNTPTTPGTNHLTGATYDDPPRPHFGPGLDATGPQFVELVRKAIEPEG